ncbi:MAG: Hsp20/alpha crystallin family protein [Candidatus Pacebacteria bacterium]|nr:Hsp20/alpha crystallin family protein [Candidatus Paceibacterota bacterium]
MFFKNKSRKEEIINDVEVEENENWNIDEGQLVIDVYETEKDLIIQAAISGIRTEDLDISLENDMLIIKGDRPDPSNSKTKKYFIRECYFGPFSREIILPREIDTSKIKAEIKEGILTIKMVKIERAKNKRINLDEDQYQNEDEEEEKPIKKKSSPKKKAKSADEDEEEEEERDAYDEEEEEEE